jgi:tellurite methyltransferase
VHGCSEKFGVVPHAVFLQNACPAAHCAPRNTYTGFFHRRALIMTKNRSVTFFDAQFEKQIGAEDYALNPFEQSALPHVRGAVLDLGCGLGNLSIAAARRGADVVALDGSAHAIDRIRKTAQAEGLHVRAELADAATYAMEGEYDAVVAIGLLMFFPRKQAMALLARLQHAVKPGGVAIVNVLIDGTTYLEMFEPGRYCLFGRDELLEQFAGWHVLRSTHDSYDAPGGTRKVFSTVIARRQ